ncbi:unnamed protein product, partial [Prorocentrum cordatum]
GKERLWGEALDVTPPELAPPDVTSRRRLHKHARGVFRIRGAFPGRGRARTLPAPRTRRGARRVPAALPGLCTSSDCLAAPWPLCLASALPRTAWQLLGRFAWPLHFLGLLGSSLAALPGLCTSSDCLAAPLQVINVREAAAALRSDTPPPGWDGGAAVSVRLLVSIWPLFSSCSSPHALPLVSRLLLLPHSSVGASSGARACRRAWCSPGCVRARLELDLAALACAAARSCIPLSAGAGRVGVQGTWPCTWLCLIALLSFQKPGVNLTCR